MPADPRAAACPPLVVHVLFRFDIGGLENGVVNLINHLPVGAFRHAILALDAVSADFARRLVRPDITLHALHKPPGHAFALYPRIWRLFRQWRPAVVHTRNLAALECQLPAWAAGVPLRIHGEHGRDVDDLDGTNRKLQRLRRLYRPFVHRYVTVSADLERYLVERVGVPTARITQIYNGVDSQRFRPAAAAEPAPDGWPFPGDDLWRIGTVGRMQGVKHQTLLARAFVQLLQRRPELRARARLVMVGDGPLRATAQALLAEAGMASLAWLPGERADVPELMRALDVFVLPSLGEGISNTILEAMASGLPVVATRVGGNAELVQPGITGELVPPDDAMALSAALERMADATHRAREMGREARLVVEQRFSLAAMLEAYGRVYAGGLRSRGG